MGASNATRAIRQWRPHLSHREFSALMVMAITAHDGDTPPVYYGGWEALARDGLGLDPATNPNSAAEQVRRVVAKLTRAGVAVSDRKARPGHNAEYALTLDPVQSVRPNGTRTKRTKRADGAERQRTVTAWEVVHRKDPRPAPEEPAAKERPTETVPLCPTETVPHTPHRNGGERPTQTVPPRSTQEQQQEEHQEYAAATPSPTSPGLVDNFQAAAEDRSIEERRNAQLAELLARYPDAADAPPF